MSMTRKRFLSFAPFLVLAAVLALRIFFSGALEEVSLKIFDRFQKWKPRVYQETAALFADIDDATLTRLGQWPWPRTLVADLVTRLQDAGAAAIVFDIVFAEPDRTSPANILELWPKNTEVESLAPKLKALPDHDEVLAQTIQNAPVVTGFILTSKDNGQKPLAKAGFAYSGDDPKTFLPVFRGAVNNLSIIEKNSKGNGSFNFLAEDDGIIRRVPVLFRCGEALYPSLFAEALRVAQGASAYMVRSSGSSSEMNFGERTGIVNIKTGNLVIPTDAQGKMWLYDTGVQKERSLPVWKIFEKDFDPETVNGKIIFLGSSASGLKDLRATPLNPVSAGTEIHVQLTEQVLTGEFLNRPDWAPGAETIYLIALGLFLVLLLPLFGALWSAVIAMGMTAAACAVSWQAFTRFHLLFDPVIPSLACLLIYLAVSLLNYLKTEMDRKQIREAFSRYLSPELVKQLANRPDQLRLGGEMKEMTVLFADIRGFTALSEKYTAQELTHFMNSFLTPMTDIILKNKGTIDKYMGDCIMAFWNAPLEEPAHAANACRAAVEMLETLQTWNRQKSSEKNFSPVQLGIGINTGRCCVGNMGSDQRFDYSVLGDDVNLASRIQGLSALYGAFVAVGENTWKAVEKDFAGFEADKIKAKGKTKPSTVYVIAGGKELKESSSFISFEKTFSEMLEACRKKDWAKAEEKLNACTPPENCLLEWNTLKETYRERLKTCRTRPPETDWDGVFIAASK